MFLSNASIKRPIAMTTVILVMTLFGLLAYRNLGVDLMPQVEFPFITVITVYPGASPDEIETGVAKKIEDAVVAVDGIRHLDSTCMNNVCQTLIEFQLDRDVDLAAMDVREKIDLIRADLPESVEDPKIMKFDINARPVVTLALTGNLPLDELYDYADNRLRDRLSTLEGVANVEITGGAKREVHVLADRKRLAARGLTTLDLARAITENNLKIPSGALKEGAREFTVTFDGEAAHIQDLGNLQVGVVEGERVYVRDVATIAMGTERVDTAAYVGGESAIAIKIVKKGEANAVKVVQRVREAVDHLQPELPGGLRLVWFRDDGDFIKASVNDAWSSVIQGILLTGAILLIFLQDVRTALIAFISMPVSIVIAFALMPSLGYTLNTPTLTAFGISVGILVTNSIVVLENIAAKVSGSRGQVREEVQKATAGVAVAVLASALTNIVVFVPVGMMQSLTGRMLSCFGVVTAMATIASLFISFTLTPILASIMLRRESRLNRPLVWITGPWEKVYRRMESFYRRSLEGAARFDGLVVAVTLIICVGGLMFVAPRVSTTFTPLTDQGEVTVKMEYPSDFNIEETSRRALEVEKKLRGYPAVIDSMVIAGKVEGMLGQVSEGPYLAEIMVKLTPKTERSANIEQIRDIFRGMLQEEPGCQYSIMIPSPIGGSSKMIEAKISGDDLAMLNTLGRTASGIMEENPLAVDIENSIRVGKPEIRIYPQLPILHDMAMPARSLGLALRGNIEGLKVSTFKKGDRTYDIRVKYDEQPGRAQVRAMNLPAPDGRPLNIDAVARLVDGEQPNQIIRSEKQRVVRLYADLAPGAGLGTAVERLKQSITTILPAGYQLTFTGMSEKMADAFGEFKTVMLIAVLLTYLLLAAILESWTQPFMIMMTVPFSYLGLYLALYLTGMSLSILGLLGGVMLIGVVVNNAILMMDEVNVLRREQGMHKREAMLKASVHKFRPIFMTSIAAVLGMLPMALGSGLGSEIRASIGVGSVGGMIVSSLLSLYFIPLFYMLVGKSDKRQDRQTQKIGI
ncbi:MAG: efflux RND transporter permease subunit [Lentisphaerota bacterium]